MREIDNSLTGDTVELKFSWKHLILLAVREVENIAMERCLMQNFDLCGQLLAISIEKEWR